MCPYRREPTSLLFWAGSTPALCSRRVRLPERRFWKKARASAWMCGDIGAPRNRLPVSLQKVPRGCTHGHGWGAVPAAHVLQAGHVSPVRLVPCWASHEAAVKGSRGLWVLFQAHVVVGRTLAVSLRHRFLMRAVHQELLSVLERWPLCPWCWK